MDQNENKRIFMVENHLRRRGIKNQNVLKAFSKVKREAFVDKPYQAYAYDDHPLPIKENQTISQPFIVALMCEAIKPKKDDKILEIGTGSGYQTAILAECVKTVYTIERFKSLHINAKAILDDLGYTNIHYIVGDGKAGYLKKAPYDAIIVSAAAKKVPEAFFTQLKDQGRLIMPVGGALFQSLSLYIKDKDAFKRYDYGGCRFVPLL